MSAYYLACKVSLATHNEAGFDPRDSFRTFSVHTVVDTGRSANPLKLRQRFVRILGLRVGIFEFHRATFGSKSISVPASASEIPFKFGEPL